MGNSRPLFQYLLRFTHSQSRDLCRSNLKTRLCMPVVRALGHLGGGILSSGGLGHDSPLRAACGVMFKQKHCLAKKTYSVTLNAFLAIPYGNDLLVASNPCIQIQVLIEQRGVGEPNQFSIADGGSLHLCPLPSENRHFRPSRGVFLSTFARFKLFNAINCCMPVCNPSRI